MFALLANLLLAFSVSGTVRAGTHALIERLSEDANVHGSHTAGAIVQSDGTDDEDSSDDESDSDLESVPPPAPPAPGNPRERIPIGDDTKAELPKFSETRRNVPAVEVLHRIARTAGWSLIIVGVQKEKIDVDVKDVDPRDAARQVLTASHSMGVLQRGKLVVVPAPEAGVAGTLVERASRKERRARGMRH